MAEGGHGNCGGWTMNRRDTVIGVALAAGLVAMLFPSANVGVDFHHDGIMLKPALDVLAGQVLFRDTFMQYGALSCYLQVVALWFQPTLLSIRLLTVAAYGVSLFFLYASWRLILPRSLAILSCGIFALLIPAGEKGWFDQYWLLLPWSSGLAMMFQSLGLYAMLRIIRSEGIGHWSWLLGASCAAVFWCRQPVGLLMFGSLVAIGFALHWARWAPTQGAKREVFVRIGAGFVAVNALFLVNILATGAFAEWWYQNFVWPRKWALQSNSETSDEFMALCLNPRAGLGLFVLLLAIAAPAAVQRFRPGSAANRFFVVWWLGLAGLLLWQHSTVLAWLHLRAGGWTVLLPLVLVLQAGVSLFHVFGGAERVRTTEYYLVAAMGAFALGSLPQYFPLPDPWHAQWALAPGFGLFVYVCWRGVGLPPLVVTLGMVAVFLPAVVVKARWTQAALARPLVTLEQPAVLRGMKVPPEQARSIGRMAAAVDQIMRHRPSIPAVMVGKDAMLLCFTQNRVNPSPYYVTWPGLTDAQEDRGRLSYVERVRPLMFFHKARWDAVNDFYRRARYVPLTYIDAEALEIAVPEDLAQAIGLGIYGLDPKNPPAGAPLKLP